MKHRVLVVDDEPLAINVIKRHLQSFDNFELVATASNAIDAFSTITKEEIDVVFLDINMPTMSGLDLIRNLKDPPMVIITTAFREYAVESFELEAIDYLVKPISLERFMNSISRIEKRIETFKNPILENQGAIASENTKDHVFLKVDKRMVKVRFDDIVYIESLKDYVCVKTKSEKLINHNNLVSIAQLLPENEFVRIHRSYIIALSKVKAIEGNCVEINGQLLPIGRNYQKEIKKLILNIVEE